MVIITARIGTEMSTRYMLHGKDKMDDNGLKAMKYIQRAGASIQGNASPPFLF